MNIAYSTELICFLILSAVIVSGSLAVVLLENIVYSAFLLGGVFMAVAGLYLLLNASFVAAAQILVYVGAVNVLILFAIMLVNKKEMLKQIEGLKTRKLISGGICGGLLLLLLRVSITTKWNTPGPISIGEEEIPIFSNFSEYSSGIDLITNVSDSESCMRFVLNNPKININFVGNQLILQFN